jgi:hypothetical protein
MLPFALIEAEHGSAVQEGVRLVGCCNLTQRAWARDPSQSAARSHPDETEAVRPSALDYRAERQSLQRSFAYVGYAAALGSDASRSGR